MKTPALMHGRDYDYRDVSGWHASEKLDGVRGFWDGAQFWTRTGKAIEVPTRIRDAMPAIRLDGEFWAGRGRFTEARLAVQCGQWTPRVRFIAFDAPGVQGDWMRRIDTARKAYGRCVAVFTIRGSRDLLRRFRQVTEGGGEGIMLHRPGARYLAGRSDRILKVKSTPRMLI